MKNYLVKIDFDCNDADYVYGLQVINEEQKEIIKRNLDKAISFGSYDFGEAECAVGQCISIEELNENQFKVLEELGLLNFGEGSDYWIDSLDDAEVFESEDEDY
jgi:hypothetical protein